MNQQGKQEDGKIDPISCLFHGISLILALSLNVDVKFQQILLFALSFHRLEMR